MEVVDLFEESQENLSVLTLEATVVTGLEFLALEECKEKCDPLKVVKTKGRILINVTKENFPKVKALRCVDNIYLVGAAKKNLPLPKIKENDLELVKGLVDDVGWEHLIQNWKELVDFRGEVPTVPQESKKSTETSLKEEATIEVSSCTENIEGETSAIKLSGDDTSTIGGGDCGSLKNGREKEGRGVSDEEQETNEIGSGDGGKSRPAKGGKVFNKGGPNKYRKELRGSKDMHGIEGQMVKYRVTCHRTGEHSFSSMEAARDFGGSLQDKFNWTVDLSYYDLEVVLNIVDTTYYVTCGLTRGSLHRRNIVEFTSTTLRATLCYGMIRLTSPQPGEILIDPLCGGGSISIEGCLAYPFTYHLCGDKDKKTLDRCNNNVGKIPLMKGSLRPDVLLWNCGRLALRTACSDVIVSDMPFGKRIGKKQDNRFLYRKFLLEMSRIVIPSTGRAALFTSDKNSFLQALSGCQAYWKGPRQFPVNQGGLNAFIFLLYRTSKTWHF